MACLRTLLLAVLLLAVQTRGSAAEPSKYVVEPPDILKVDVAGLPKKAAKIESERLVRPDGTISLGVYGDVSVSGLTIEQARGAVVKRLAKFAKKKKSKVEVKIEVTSFNSKVYYVIVGGRNERVERFPCRGSDTVLDAITGCEGAAEAARKGKLWVRRGEQTLPVDWRGITEQGITATNYQLLPGDRLVVDAFPSP